MRGFVKYPRLVAKASTFDVVDHYLSNTNRTTQTFGAGVFLAIEIPALETY